MNKLFTAVVFSASTLVNLAIADDTPQELEEVVVTGDMGIKHARPESAKPVVALSEDVLRTKIGQTLGETLQNELGITSQSFGAGVGMPVIRGQSGSRVKVMQNSLGNNDVSSLSPDHANGVDPIIAERVEVLRGPSTLLYGTGAIGGIVNVIDNRIPEQVPDKIIGGAAEQRYDSATSESASALKLDGGKNHIAYHVDGFYRDQDNTHIGGQAIDETAARQQNPSLHNLQNSYGVISGTQARSRGGSLGLSLIGDMGLVGAAINSLEKKYGIPSDGQANEAPVTVELTQSKYDFKAQLNKPFAFAEQLRMKFGYTDYKHVEFDGNEAGTTFMNESFESRLELEHRPIGIVKGTAGFQSTNSQFTGFGQGQDGLIVPESDIDTYALFDVESFAVDDITYQLGGRAEWQSITPKKRYDAVSYLPISGSASALWKITDQHQLSLGITHSQRAPQIQELFSDGFHDATHSYEKGNINLNKEISNNLDLNYTFNSSWMTAEISLFHNWVSDYIYQQRSSTQLFNSANDSFVSQTLNTSCSTCFPVLNTQQAAATFKGFEAQTIFPLMENSYGALDLTLFGDYTRGTFDNGGDVPRMPPLRYGFQLSYEKNDFSSNLRFTRAEAQTNTGNNDTNTKGYLLLNLQTQYRLASFYDSEVLLFAKGKNLLNENIRNSTSYLRNFSPEPGRSAELGIRISY